MAQKILMLTVGIMILMMSVAQIIYINNKGQEGLTKSDISNFTTIGILIAILGFLITAYYAWELITKG
jgi:hypothetical protein